MITVSALIGKDVKCEGQGTSYTYKVVEAIPVGECKIDEQLYDTEVLLLLCHEGKHDVKFYAIAKGYYHKMMKIVGKGRTEEWVDILVIKEGTPTETTPNELGLALQNMGKIICNTLGECNE